MSLINCVCEHDPLEHSYEDGPGKDGAWVAENWCNLCPCAWTTVAPKPSPTFRQFADEGMERMARLYPEETALAVARTEVEREEEWREVAELKVLLAEMHEALEDCLPWIDEHANDGEAPEELAFRIRAVLAKWKP